MRSAVVAQFRRVVETMVAFRAPHELAAGVALGGVIGLVPKGNLIALSLCVLLFSLRVNKGLALAAAVFISCFATWADPFAHKLGLAVLTTPSLQGCFAMVFELPLGPWLGLSNTVVVGALLVGLYVAYPLYFLSRTAITWGGSHLRARLGKSKQSQIAFAVGESDMEARTSSAEPTQSLSEAA